jgi:hypothetical protein
MKAFSKQAEQKVAESANSAGMQENPEVLAFMNNKGARTQQDVTKVMNVINNPKNKPKGSLITGGNSLLGQ